MVAVVQERAVEYYEKENGECPFRDWLVSLKDKKGRQKILTRIDRVSIGNLGHCEPVGEGVFELKINFGPGYRVYFGQSGKELTLLMNGGDKSTQQKDIKKAHEYWADYQRRVR